MKNYLINAICGLLAGGLIAILLFIIDKTNFS